MSDGLKITKASQPDLDPSKLLVQIESLIKAKSIEKTDDKTSSRTSKSWIWALILPVVVLFGIVVVTWMFGKHNRELAKLRHEKNKAKILEEQTELFLKLNKNDEKVALAQKQLDVSKNRLRLIDADIDAEEKRYEANIDALDRICTWDASYVRKSG